MKETLDINFPPSDDANDVITNDIVVNVVVVNVVVDNGPLQQIFASRTKRHFPDREARLKKKRSFLKYNIFSSQNVLSL